MKDRIRMIQEREQMTQRDFAAALGISPSSLSSLYNGHTSPTNNHVLAIHRRFPEVNVNWLLFGEGEMTDENTTDAVAAPAADVQGESVRPLAFDEPLLTNVPDVNPHQSVQPEGSTPEKIIYHETVKYIDKPQRKITEIRVFYDDGTFDTFSGQRE
ncbi:MAG: helix-turn-helix domain-containing protein [Bacteroidales bacterium]|nr:helix-turn-helix domain-containing protein [Bacteroidales bacterium]